MTIFTIAFNEALKLLNELNGHSVQSSVVIGKVSRFVYHISVDAKCGYSKHLNKNCLDYRYMIIPFQENRARVCFAVWFSRQTQLKLHRF